ncbi:MAG: phage integrase SAM-like domain-containing protein, partial [Verrucomicrobiota bacterium]
MASIHRQPGRPFWYCAFTTPDGVRRFKSTKTTDRKQAIQISQSWERASREGKNGKLTPERARAIIAAGVADVYSAATQEHLPCGTFKAWVEQWLQTKTIELMPSSFSRYEQVINSFVEFMGPKANKDISVIQPREISKWRDQIAKSLSVASANLSLKCLRVCLSDALKNQLISSNPASIVKTLKRSTDSRRREMTIIEIKRVLECCNSPANQEWRGLILFGLYSGQRLGDLRSLTWRNIDLKEEELR